MKEPEYQEGWDSALRGDQATDCPYLKHLIGAEAVTQDEFDAQYRSKLVGWFLGWGDGTRHKHRRRRLLLRKVAACSPCNPEEMKSE